MPREDNSGPEVRDAPGGLIEIVDFEPEKDTISGRDVGIANGTVMMLDLPPVQLKHQPAA